MWRFFFIFFYFFLFLNTYIEIDIRNQYEFIFYLFPYLIKPIFVAVAHSIHVFCRKNRYSNIVQIIQQEKCRNSKLNFYKIPVHLRSTWEINFVFAFKFPRCVYWNLVLFTASLFFGWCCCCCLVFVYKIIPQNKR